MITVWDLKQQLVLLDNEAYRSINVCNILLQDGESPKAARAKLRLQQLREEIDDILYEVEHGSRNKSERNSQRVMTEK